MTRLYHIRPLFSLLLFTLLAFPGQVQADKMRGGAQGGSVGMDMAQLSPEEQQVVRDLMQKYHGQMVDMHKKIFAKRAELNAAMAQEEFNAGNARSLVKDIAKMQSDLTQMKLNMFIEMREKGVSYYGTCMVGGGMGPCLMGDGRGSGGMGRGMMPDGDMMGYGMGSPAQE
ncbi:MAG: periplasmic heavy metal sensor [Syntrophotaleaceae bacterium]